MSLPFWDAGAIDKDGRSPGITSFVPAGFADYPDELSPWDVIYLNGERAPGICRLDGGRHLGIDIQRIIGQMVPRSALLNYDPVPFTLTLTLWTPGQWAALQEMIPQFLPPPGMNPKLQAVRAEHPSLGLYGISTVWFQSGSFPRNLGKGIVEFEFQCYEFNPDLSADVEVTGNPPPQVATPPGTQPTSPVTPPSQAPIPP